jgi:copper resistance protein C
MKKTLSAASFAMFAALLIGPLAAAPAAAHALPTGEMPRVGSTVAASPAEVTIWFDAPIESLFAKLQVLDAAGRERSQGSPLVGHDRRTLSVRIPPLNAGVWTVKWSVVAMDGHRTRGSYVFTVARGAT